MSERVAIVGSRDYPDPAEVVSYVLSLPAGTIVVSGGARNVDSAGEAAASARGLEVVSYRPVKRFGDWHILKYVIPANATVLEVSVATPESFMEPWTFPTFGRAAYFRNSLIVRDSDRVVAFWDGRSKGTRNSIELARKAGKLGTVHRPKVSR